jgi:hypothetical protein
MSHVEEKSAGSIGDVDRFFSCETEADVVLRQHDRANAAPICRLVFAHPKEFCDCEVRQRRIAGELDQALGADFLGERSALRPGANVTPDQRRADHFVCGVEHDSAMHLTRETDARDVFRAQVGSRQSFANGDTASAPPVFGLLLGPSDRRRSERSVFFGRRTCDFAAFIQQDRPRATRADIDAQEMDRTSPPTRSVCHAGSPGILAPIQRFRKGISPIRILREMIARARGSLQSGASSPNEIARNVCGPAESGNEHGRV